MLQNIRIASPCLAEWEQMAGDDRVRYCPLCNLNVYNLSEMTEPEVQQLLASREGRLCARLYQRRDGTVLTKDCPVGVRAVVRRISRVAGAVLSALSLPFAVAQYSQSGGSEPPAQIANQETGIELYVKDPSGAAIPHAKVTLVEETSRKKTKGKTDLQGRFFRTKLPEGKYHVKVQREGFITYTGTVLLQEHALLKSDVKLELGPVTVTVGKLVSN